LEYDHDTGWAQTHTSQIEDADRLCKLHHKRKTAGWYLAGADPGKKRRLLPPNHPEHPLHEAARAARAHAAAIRTA
jgi:hypothetical protein